MEIKPTPKIVIESHTYTKYEWLACCLAHEYRHSFQFYWVRLMNDILAKIWKEELVSAKNSNNINLDDPKEYAKYKLQAIEVDAEAFAIHYLRTDENINIRKKEEWFQRLIEAYIVKYRNRL